MYSDLREFLHFNKDNKSINRQLKHKYKKNALLEVHMVCNKNHSNLPDESEKCLMHVGVH